VRAGSKTDRGAALADIQAVEDAGVVVRIVVPVLVYVVLLPVAPQRVRLFAVRGVVTHQQKLLRHAQRAQELYEDHDDASDHRVPADDEHRPAQLLPELDPPHSAVESTCRVYSLQLAVFSAFGKAVQLFQAQVTTLNSNRPTKHLRMAPVI